MKFELDPRRWFQQKKSESASGMGWITLAGRIAKTKGEPPLVIGLTDQVDQGLFCCYLAIRLLKTTTYNTSWLLSLPEVQAMSNDSTVKKVQNLDDIRKRALADTERINERHIRINYPTLEDRLYARTIELAVNDLVGRMTVEDENGIAGIKFKEDDTIEYWKERWKPELETYRQGRTITS